MTADTSRPAKEQCTCLICGEKNSPFDNECRHCKAAIGTVKPRTSPPTDRVTRRVTIEATGTPADMENFLVGIANATDALYMEFGNLRGLSFDYRQPLEPSADVAALNRELCEKEGHVLGVECRPCLRCHAQLSITKNGGA